MATIEELDARLIILEQRLADFDKQQEEIVNAGKKSKVADKLKRAAADMEKDK